MRFIKSLLVSIIIILLLSNVAYVQTVNQIEQKMIITFTWDYDPNVTVDNFNIYSRSQKGVYNNIPTYIIDPNVRTYTTPEQPLQNLWFVATATGDNIESGKSNEVTNYPIPPYNFDMTVEYLIRLRKIE